MFPVSKNNSPSELHISLRYVGDYYNEFETLFGLSRPPFRLECNQVADPALRAHR